MTETVTVRVSARVHLAGNPSDGYGGAVLSTVVPELAATVEVTPGERFELRAPSATWADIDDLTASCARVGHESGDRLVTAAIVALHRRLGPDVARAPVHVEWSTTIPRSVGLGGSSALVVGVIRACLDVWGASLTPLAIAEIALAAETDELGLAAGIADRVAQVWDTTVLTDCRDVVPIATPLPVHASGEDDFVLAWHADAAAPSDDYHRRLRVRAAGGDDEVGAAMAALAALADEAAEAILAGDLDALATAMDRSLELRQSLGHVPAAAIEPVAALRAAGGRVNFAGSGGALVIRGADAPPGWSWRGFGLA